MKVSKIKYAVCVLVLLLAGVPLAEAGTSSNSLVPKGMVIEETFKPGPGKPIGKIQLVQGKVIVIHTEVLRGYHLEKNFPLFKGDTIITLNKGRIRFKMNDGSTLTLASKTKLVLNRSVYDPSGKRRSSFLSMSMGKVRFLVKKLTNFKEPEFKVKTKTAVVGVRGSDFIVRATSELTEVTTLDNTVLDVVSIANIEKPPTVLAEFERILVTEDDLSNVMKVTREERELLMMEMIIDTVRAEPAGIIKVRKGKEREKKTQKDAAMKPVAKPELPEKPGKAEIEKPVARPEKAESEKPETKPETPEIKEPGEDAEMFEPEESEDTEIFESEDTEVFESEEPGEDAEMFEAEEMDDGKSVIVIPDEGESVLVMPGEGESVIVMPDEGESVLVMPDEGESVISDEGESVIPGEVKPFIVIPNDVLINPEDMDTEVIIIIEGDEIIIMQKDDFQEQQDDITDKTAEQIKEYTLLPDGLPGPPVGNR